MGVPWPPIDVPATSHTGTWKGSSVPQKRLVIAAATASFCGMTNADEPNPFKGLDDQPGMTTADTRTALLASAQRGYAPLRKEFVQKTRGSGERASVLARLVTGRHERPLDALLLLHALEPVVRNDPLDIATWARLLGSEKTPWAPNAVTKAFSTLVELELVRRERAGRRADITPLNETGDGSTWTRPGEVEGNSGPGYFVIPYAYWNTGLCDTLRLAGKAMFLIILAETQDPRKTSFLMPVERAAEWYGLSERTAERGYAQLRDAGVLLVHGRKVPDPRHPAGRRDEFHRALNGPYSTFSRGLLQTKTRKATRKRAARSSATAET